MTPQSPSLRPTDLSPEQHLLLYCAQAGLGRERSEQIRQLAASPLDWTALICLAQRHQLLPLTYQIIKKELAHDVPASALAQLQALHKRYVQRTFVLTHQLCAIVDGLAQRQIPVMPYKGPVLGALYYGNSSLRQFSDLDILIQRRDLFQAKQVLVDLAYHPLFIQTANEEVKYLKAGYVYDYHFIRDELEAQVELHWQITSSFRLSAEEIWGRARPVTVLGRSILHFAPEDLVLILCEHGAKHRWEVLQWLCDLAQLLRVEPEIDWDLILETAHRIGRRRTLLLGLALAQDLLEAAVPADLRRLAERDAKVRDLAGQTMLRLFHEVEGWPGVWYSLLIEETWSNKMRYLAQLAEYTAAPNHKDRDFLKLPSYLAYFYFVVRPLRLALKSGTTLKNYLAYQSKAGS
jgi:hypothetical protein